MKTYSLLGPRTTPPSEYEIVSSRLLYYVERGFEVDVPLQQWYRDHQQASRFFCRDWEAFVDPRETTYTKYTHIQAPREAAIDGILESIERDGYDRSLSRPWLEALSRVLPPLRYLLHGLHMVTSYIGHMAPSGRITIAALFQAADELRRIERIAYRMRQLQGVWPEFGKDAREAWQHGPAWQPTRETVERLLTTYDWGEALIALQLCVKPLVDERVLHRLSGSARQEGDPRLANLLDSLDEDCVWHRAWAASLIEIATRSEPATRAAVDEWTEKWSAPAQRAIELLAPLAQVARP